MGGGGRRPVLGRPWPELSKLGASVLGSLVWQALRRAGGQGQHVGSTDPALGAEDPQHAQGVRTGNARALGSPGWGCISPKAHWSACDHCPTGQRPWLSQHVEDDFRAEHSLPHACGLPGSKAGSFGSKVRSQGFWNPTREGPRKPHLWASCGSGNSTGEPKPLFFLLCCVCSRDGRSPHLSKVPALLQVLRLRLWSQRPLPLLNEEAGKSPGQGQLRKCPP